MKAVKFTKMAAQGDLLIIKVEKMPDNLEAAKTENGNHILAHSETGHSHVVKEKAAQLMIDKTNEFIAYLNVLEPCEVEHLRSFDTHAPIALDKGIYEIRRQREYTPQGLRKVMD